MQYVKTKSLILIAVITTLYICNAVVCQDVSAQTSHVETFYDKNNPQNKQLENSKDLDMKYQTTGHDSDAEASPITNKTNVVKSGSPFIEKESKNSTVVFRQSETEWKKNSLQFIKEAANKTHASEVKPRKRRGKRSVEASSHSVNQAYCGDVPFWQSTSFIFAVSSWSLLVVVSTCFAHTVYRRHLEYKVNQENDNARKPGTISITAKELKLYHDLSERRRIIKQLTSEDEYDVLRCGFVDAVDVIISVDDTPSYENIEQPLENGDEEYSSADIEYEERVSNGINHYSTIDQGQSYSDVQYSSGSTILDDNYSNYDERQLIELTSQTSSGEEASQLESVAPSEHEWQLDQMSYVEGQTSEENASSVESGGSFLNEILMTRAVMFPSVDQLSHSQIEPEQFQGQESIGEALYAIQDTESETII